MAEIASILSNSSDTARLRLLANEGNVQANSEVLEQFEALFLQQMLKSMRTASLGSGLFQSEQMEFYRDMYDQHIAANLAEKELLGISSLINKQLGTESSAIIEPGDLSSTSDEAVNNGQINSSTYADTNVEIAAHQVNVNQASLGKSVFTEPGDSQNIINKLQFFSPKSPQEFANVAYEYSHAPARKLGVSPEVLVAISALETGWGKHLPSDQTGSSNNYFGIKADSRWQGEKVDSQTLEFENGVFNTLNQPFRAYDTLKDSFNDFADFILSNERYQNALEFAHDTKRFLQEIQNAGYATDPAYSDKILKILDNKVFSNIRK